MKNIFALCLFAVLFSACSKKESLTTLQANFKLKYGLPSITMPSTKEITLYLFKNYSAQAGDTYAGNGIIQKSTGEKISYSEKVQTNFSFYIFSGLEKVTHTVVADGTGIFNDKVKVKFYMGSINLGNDLSANGGTLDFVWDIWPYVPADVFL